MPATDREPERAESEADQKWLRWPATNDAEVGGARVAGGVGDGGADVVGAYGAVSRGIVRRHINNVEADGRYIR